MEKRIESKDAYGTGEIAAICNVTPVTVARWIEQGKVPSFHTAGGHRRVWKADLLIFLKTLNVPIPPNFLEKDQ